VGAGAEAGVGRAHFSVLARSRADVCVSSESSSAASGAGPPAMPGPTPCGGPRLGRNPGGMPGPGWCPAGPLPRGPMGPGGPENPGPSWRGAPGYANPAPGGRSPGPPAGPLKPCEPAGGPGSGPGCAWPLRSAPAIAAPGASGSLPTKLHATGAKSGCSFGGPHNPGSLHAQAWVQQCMCQVLGAFRLQLHRAKHRGSLHLLGWPMLCARGTCIDTVPTLARWQTS